MESGGLERLLDIQMIDQDFCAHEQENQTAGQLGGGTETVSEKAP